jgi:hypothetical protein
MWVDLSNIPVSQAPLTLDEFTDASLVQYLTNTIPLCSLSTTSNSSVLYYHISLFIVSIPSTSDQCFIGWKFFYTVYIPSTSIL